MIGSAEPAAFERFHHTPLADTGVAVPAAK